MKKLMTYLLTALLMSSCSYAFNMSLRNSAELDIPFVSVQSNIDRDIGAVFIWGGVIVNTVISDSGSYLEVVQMPLDKYGKIVDPAISHGRFIVFSPSQLDSSQHAYGYLLSVAGVLIKGVDSSIDGRDYTYPVMEATGIRIWDKIEGKVPAAKFPSELSTVFPWSITSPQ